MRVIKVLATCDRCGFDVEDSDPGFGILVALGQKKPVRADLCDSCLANARDALDKSIVLANISRNNGGRGGVRGKKEKTPCPMCEKLISIGAGQVLHSRKFHGLEKEDVWGANLQPA